MQRRRAQIEETQRLACPATALIAFRQWLQSYFPGAATAGAPKRISKLRFEVADVCNRIGGALPA